MEFRRDVFNYYLAVSVHSHLGNAGTTSARRLRFIPVGTLRRLATRECVRCLERRSFIGEHYGDLRPSPPWPFAWPDAFPEYLMTEHCDGRFACCQAMLREEVGNRAVRCALLPQFRDDALCR